MGGGDLNLKKSWHPSTFANLKKLWEAEQGNLQESQKLEQLRKEKEAERDAEEMQKLQEGAGLLRFSKCILLIFSTRPERVEWMYAGSSVASTSLAEEYLLGRRRLDHIPQTDLDDTATVNSASTTRRGPLSASAQVSSSRDLESKLREDPLFTIKKKEQEVVQDINRNPLKRAHWERMARPSSGVSKASTSSPQRDTRERRRSKSPRDRHERYSRTYSKYNRDRER